MGIPHEGLCTPDLQVLSKPKANPNQRWRPAPLLCISPLSSEQTATADFILDPPPTRQNTALASAPPVLSPPDKNSVWKYFLSHLLGTNKSGPSRSIIVASVRVPCLLHQLSPPVTVSHTAHTNIQRVCIHALQWCTNATLNVFYKAKSCPNHMG